MSILKGIEKTKRKLFNLYVTDKEADVFKKYADLYTNGNVSAWMRYAAINYRPKRSELIPDQKSE